MGKFDNPVGHTQGRLRVLRFHEKRGNFPLWWCLCDPDLGGCGKEVSVRIYDLFNENSMSCGCWKVEMTVERSTTHGHATGGISPTYHSWAGMIARCEDPNHVSFPRYGGRGIKVCDRWKGENGFINFLADMGERPEDRTISRKGNDGHYEPDNCEWGTDEEQANNKNNNSTLTLHGKTQTIAQWSRELGVHSATLSDRKQNGWTDEEILTTPVGESKHSKRYGPITFNGETLTLEEWADKLQLPIKLLRHRRWRGLPVEKLLSPVKKN